MEGHRITPTEYCQKLRSEIVNKKKTPLNELEIRILDFFIDKNLIPDEFEKLLQVRISDEDLAKEESRAICTEILEGWRNQIEIESRLYPRQ